MAAATAQTTDNRCLEFRMGSSRFHLAAHHVVEVLRRPQVTRVPHAPAALVGIANLRGTAIPVVALDRLLDAQAQAAGAAQKLIVYDHGTPVGLLVDDVLQFGDAATAEGQAITDLDARLAAAFVAGLQFRGGRSGRSGSAAEPVETAAAVARLHGLLSFRIAGQTFALPLDSVHEVLRFSDEIAAVAGSDATVLGLIPLRQTVLPVVSLANLLALPPAATVAGSARIVVVHFDSALLGLAVDAIDAIRRLPDSAIDPVPPVLARSSGRAEIAAIGRADGGRTLISILSAEKLFGNSTVRQAVEAREGAVQMSGSQSSPVALEQFLIFQLGAETYGMPIAAVDEVVRVPDIVTRMPNAPRFVAGVINLRGRPVPLIDQRQRFETPEAQAAEKPRAIIVSIGALQAGFVVDAVTEVLALPASALSAAPDFSSDQAEIFDRVAHIEADGRMILLVDAQALLSRSERDVITELAQAAAPAVS